MHIKTLAKLLQLHRERIERLRRTEDLPPPWNAYPDLPQTSMGWRMGTSEEYFRDWRIWLSALPPQRREDYRQKYPEPESWPDTYQRLFESFAREPHGKTWDEFWDAEFQKQYEM